jgi:hypothetical protein
MMLFILFLTLSALAAGPDKNLEILRPVVNANSTLNANPVKPLSSSDMSCACSIQGSENQVTFETPNSCGPERNYLQAGLREFAKIDPKGSFLATRPFLPGNNRVPQKCVLYVMRTAFRDVARTPEEKKAEDIQKGVMTPEEIAAKNYTPDHSQFASCPTANGEPVRIRQKPCVTEPYFNLIYNSLTDVADCLDLPMNLAVPKFANESGLNVNVLGPVDDGGVGQFTESALKDVAVHYPDFKAQILASKNPACQRLRSIPGALVNSAADIRTADNERCHAIAMPPNPVRSMIYYGIFYHAMKQYAANAWSGSDAKNPDDENVDSLLARASATKLDAEKIKQMLFVMAYNSGARPPVTGFKEWLRYRLSLKNGKISAKDFDFNFWPPKGFSAIQKDAEKDVLEIATQQGWSEARTRQEVSAERVKRRIAHVGAVGRVLTLPEYFYVYQNSIYISAVKVQARELDKALGAGTCTQPKFLAL